MKTQDIKNIASAYKQVLEGNIEEKKMDKVNPKALEKDFDDREDKDIDNDGDTDASDEYLHNRRKAVKNAMKKEEADLDEAAPKMKGDSIKAIRQQDAAHAAAMGRSVKTGRKLPTKTMTSTQRSLASMRNEEVEIDEDISKMSHSRLKWHMNTGVPHGSYTKDEMKKEKERRMKTGEGEAYKKAKPALEGTNMSESRWPILQRIMERQNYSNMDNGSPRGEGLSPSAKKELERTEGDSGIDGAKAAEMTAKSIAQSAKPSPKRRNDRTEGDKTMPKPGA